jgi:hypothetical protein
VDGWQDISTAPRGESVLVTNDLGPRFPKPRVAIATQWSDGRTWMVQVEWRNKGPQVHDLYFTPTHWMPLPKRRTERL